LFIGTSDEGEAVLYSLLLSSSSSSPGVKRPGLEADHKPQSAAEIKNVSSWHGA